jgi:hypothetical protein
MNANGANGPETLWVEVSDERFTEPVQRSFKRAGEPQHVTAVDLDGAGFTPVCALELSDGEVVTGPAHACLVEDSGSGVVWLVYGGAAGLWIAAGAARGERPRADEPGATFDAYLLVDRDALVFA